MKATEVVRKLNTYEDICKRARGTRSLILILMRTKIKELRIDGYSNEEIADRLQMDKDILQKYIDWFTEIGADI